jgi:hypothetical protein
MSNAAETLKTWVALLKEAFSAIGVMVIVIAGIWLLIPHLGDLNKRITRALTVGEVEVNLGAIKFTLQNEEQVATVQAASDKLAEVTKVLEQGRVLSPTQKSELSAVQSSLAGLASSTQTIEVAANAISKSESTGELTVSSATSGLQGWMFLGRIEGSPSRWADGKPQTVREVAWPLRPGMTLTVRDDAYVRALEGPSNRSERPVVGVARVGQMVKVLEEPFLSSARIGGSFVWVRVEVTRG